MKISKQGETYEENIDTQEEATQDAVEDTDEDYDDDDDEYDEEDDEETNIKTFFGIPSKYIIIGAAVLVIVIILVIIFKHKSDSDVIDGTYDETTYDETTYDTSYEDTSVDNTSYDNTSYDTTEEQEPQHEVSDVVDSDEDAKLLSQYGYTGEEIELAKQYNLSVEAMVTNAKNRQDNAVRESIKQLSSTGSIAYQNIVNKTYLGQEKNAEPVNQKALPEGQGKESVTEQMVNCTYEKCPTYGVQLFLKCKVFNGVYVWYAISPQRWVELPDSGSIVLNVTYVHYGDNVYVADVREAASDLQTVQTDNTTNMQDVEDTDDSITE